MYKILYSILFSCCIYSGLLDAAASVKVSRDNISMDETLTLIIATDDPDSVSTLNLQPVEVDFDILSNSESSQFQMINGKTTASKQWQLTLAPKRKGTLTIPSLEIGSGNTDSIRIMVSESVPMEQRAGVDNIFMEAELSSTDPWVQQELIYTTRIYYYPALNRGAELSPLDIPNAIVTQISEANYEKKINNKNYIVYEIKYAVFPQSSGLMEIPGQLFQGSLADPARPRSFFGFSRDSGNKAVRLRNETKAVTVQPRPDTFSGKHWLPARDIKLREEWSENPNGISVGQPVTRAIIIEADGLQASQLPPLVMPDLIGAQTYPDDPETSETASIKGVRSVRTEKMAIIPSSAGNLTLPAIEFNWWNTSSQTMETATLPERTLAILPSSSRASSTSPNNENQRDSQSANASINENLNAPTLGNTNHSNYWQYAFFAVLALWLLTMLGLLLKKQSRQQKTTLENTPIKTTESQAYQQLQAAKNDPATLRSAILDWGKLFWKHRNINSLSDITLASSNQPLKQELMALDASLFQTNASGFDSVKLLEAIDQERSHYNVNTKNTSTKIRPLYKTDIS